MRATLGLTRAVRLRQLRLEHGVRMRREGVPQLPSISRDRLRRGLHGGLPEIILRLDVRPVYLGRRYGSAELFVLGLELRLDRLIAVAIDDVDHDRTVVPCG